MKPNDGIWIPEFSRISGLELEYMAINTTFQVIWKANIVEFLD